MSMHDLPDFSLYTHSVGIAAAYAKSTIQRLVNAAPPDKTAEEHDALRRAERIADRVDSIRWQRRGQSAARVKPLRNMLIQQVLRLHAVLTALATMPRELGDRGVRAQRLAGTIFPDGAGFITEDADIGWTETRIRLAFIDERQLKEEIASVVGGPELVTAIENAVRDLGDALGVGATKPEMPSVEDLRDERTKLSRAVAAYCRILAAKVNEDDLASIERFRAAVLPIDEYRAVHGRGASLEEEDEEEIVEPITEPPRSEPLPA